MSIIGSLDILGVMSDDEDDIVAAFIGDECRGVAHPVYKERYDGYYVTMDIYALLRRPPTYPNRLVLAK